ncbi:unnamed protein product [Rhizophagus irregularis]|nr:unnamed protein product [Rhizophagus irregularis]
MDYGKKVENINDGLKCNVMEFINAPVGYSNPQACYTSRLFKKLNEILESENSQAYRTSHFSSRKLSKMLASEDLNDCIIKDNEVIS